MNAETARGIARMQARGIARMQAIGRGDWPCLQQKKASALSCRPHGSSLQTANYATALVEPEYDYIAAHQAAQEAGMYDNVDAATVGWRAPWAAAPLAAHSCRCDWDSTSTFLLQGVDKGGEARLHGRRAAGAAKVHHGRYGQR